MKKLLSILTLLLCVCSGAWAADFTATWGNVSSSKMTATLSPSSVNAIATNAVLGTSPINFSFNGTGSVSGDSNSGLSSSVTATKIKIPGVSSATTTDAEMISFTLKPKTNYTFTPTSIVFYAAVNSFGNKNASDNEYISYTVNSGSTEVKSKVTPKIGRSDSGTGLTKITISEGLGSAYNSTDGLTLKLYLNSGYSQSSNKNINIYGVTFSGSIDAASLDPFTVKFDAGEHGTYTGGDIAEESAGAGIILPALTTKEDGWAFNGWYTAATDGTKAGDAGDTYNPTEDVTLYAQYSEEVAPTISIDNYAPSTSKGSAITLTATPTGSPTPTVTWYQSATATNTGGTEKATGLTYKPDVTAEGTFYYYAVASNGVSPDATSNLITLTVTDPNKYATNNAYYMSVGETPVPDEQIIGDDITMTFVNGKAGESFTAGVTDLSVNGVNKNFVASISGSNSNNGWKARFVPTTDGVLSVGVVINKNKTFSISNATEFRYQGKNGANEDVDETNNSSSLTTADNDNAKLYVVVTISVKNGKTYDFSVASSKMGFYGFEFHKAETKNMNADGYSTFSSNYDVEVSGAKAYTAKLDLVNNTITCTEIADSKVPAGAGVLLFKEANAEVTFTPTYGVAALSNNDLKGSTKADGSLATEETGHTYYVLNGDTFKEYTATTFVAGKAYFDVEGGAVQGKLTIVFDDDMTTTIDNLTISQSDKNAQMYNLSGQKVNESYKGIVIVSGKKYINK